MNLDEKIVVTGAAGLVGQNLVLMLRERGYRSVVAIDKQPANLRLLARPESGRARRAGRPGGAGGLGSRVRRTPPVARRAARADHRQDLRQPFLRNNSQASALVFAAIRGGPGAVHGPRQLFGGELGGRRRLHAHQEDAGADVPRQRPARLRAAADADVRLVRPQALRLAGPLHGEGAGLPDPGPRPLHAPAAVRARLLPRHPAGASRTGRLAQIYDLVGSERIDYIDIIRAIRARQGPAHADRPHSRCRCSPRCCASYALFSDKPPFTADQLKALTAGDDFTGVDIARTFGFEPTPFADGIRETFCHPVYGAVRRRACRLIEPRHERIPPPRSVAVIGAGPMGLAAAYDLAKARRQVTVFERDDRIGGMSAHSSTSPARASSATTTSSARPDQTTFDYLSEFGLDDRLRWTDTKMGFYFDGRLYDWGQPAGAAASFPGLEPARQAALRAARDARQGHRPTGGPTTPSRPPSG